MTRPAVFLDRDGVLNEIVEREGRPGSPRALDEFRLVDDIESVRRLGDEGFLVFLVTNQPDIARGRVTPELIEAMTAAIRRRVRIDDVRVCPHEEEDNCACRKPKPGMLLDLARHWRVDVRDSWFIGDMWRDVQAARAAGVRAVLLRRPYNADVEADAVASTLGEAVECILAEGIEP